MKSSPDHMPKDVIVNWVSALTSIVGVVGGLAILAQKIRVYFYPSAEWIQLITPVAPLLALIPTTLFAWALSMKRGVTRGTDFQKTALLLLGPLIIYFCSAQLILGSGPMLAALLFGKSTMLSFQVEGVPDRDIHRCPDPITLKDMPFFYQTICGTSAELRMGLVPEDQLTLIGRGTWMGAFAGEWHRRD